ncbi:MAG: serine hydrolase [Chloroflexi bacterium]|nr:serine hydrolase [Chloroflexota bacterium]
MKTLKVIRNLLIGVLTLFILLFALVVLAAGPDTALRMAYYNVTDIDDYKLFPARELSAGGASFHFEQSADPWRVPASIKGVSLDQLLENPRTAAFLIIKDDAILYERYFDGYDESTPIQVFSVAKSLFSILVGRAVEDGYFNVDQLVTDFVPELAANGFDRVTIEHLLQMASGSNYRQTGFDELSPFSLHPRFEYSPRLEKEITTTLEVIDEPGTEFIYKSGDTALLSLVLTRALKDKSITEYMQEAIWTPLGMEYDGIYTIDHTGDDALEKTWCCLALTARDLAKFGRLMLEDGNWNGTQIIPSAWVEKSTHVDSNDTRDFGEFGSIPGFRGYQYQWWLASQDEAYYGNGHLGQFLYVNPVERVIIVRLGRVGNDPLDWLGLFEMLAKDVE